METPAPRPEPHNDAELLQAGYRYALALTHRPADAEDLVQEAWLNLMRRYGRVDSRAVLFTVVRNLFIDQCRRRRVVAFTSLDAPDAPPSPVTEPNEAGVKGDLDALLGTLRADVAVVPVGLMEFFATKQEVDPAPEGKEALHALLVQRGAPPDFRIPASLLPLENAACQVIDMHGKDVYLACFWRVDGAGRGLSELVHLVVARRDDFRDAPPSTQPQFSEPDGWSFASWSEADIIYTLAAPAPMDILRPFAPGTLSADRAGDFLAVSLNTWSFSAFLIPIREDSAQWVALSSGINHKHVNFTGKF